MENNTGLTLSQIKGPLTNLLENLSGEHCEYWLGALKKLLRKEKLPNPPDEVLKQMESYDFRTASLQKIKHIADYLKNIPTVNIASIVDDEDRGLINIGIYANVTDFLRQIKDQDDASFYLQANGKIKSGSVDEKDADETYDNWYEKYFKESEMMDLKDFCKAIIELGQMYEDAILQIEV